MWRPVNAAASLAQLIIGMFILPLPLLLLPNKIILLLPFNVLKKKILRTTVSVILHYISILCMVYPQSVYQVFFSFFHYSHSCTLHFNYCLINTYFLWVTAHYKCFYFAITVTTPSLLGDRYTLITTSCFAEGLVYNHCNTKVEWC